MAESSSLTYLIAPNEERILIKRICWFVINMLQYICRSQGRIPSWTAASESLKILTQREVTASMKSLVKVSYATQVTQNEERNLLERTVTSIDYILQCIYIKEELSKVWTAGEFRLSDLTTTTVK